MDNENLIGTKVKVIAIPGITGMGIVARIHPPGDVPQKKMPLLKSGAQAEVVGVFANGKRLYIKLSPDMFMDDEEVQCITRREIQAGNPDYDKSIIWGDNVSLDDNIVYIMTATALGRPVEPMDSDFSKFQVGEVCEFPFGLDNENPIWSPSEWRQCHSKANELLWYKATIVEVVNRGATPFL